MKSLGTLIVVCISLVVVGGAHAQNLDGISDISPTSLAKSHGATITSPIEAQRPAVDADIIRMAQTKLQLQPQKVAPSGPSQIIEGVTVPQKVAPSGRSQIIEGVTVRRNKATAQPGYILEKGPNNTVVARRIGGSPSTSVSLDCKCGSTGFCKTDSDADIAVCFKNPGVPCQTACNWANPLSSSGGLIAQ